MSPELLVELAWRASAPVWTHGLQFKADSWWPRVAVLAVKWAREGLSEEAVRAEVARMEETYRAEINRRNVEILQGHAAPAPSASAIERAVRTAGLLDELLG